MKRHLSRFKPARLICAALMAYTLLIFCGLSTFAAEEGSPDLQKNTPLPVTAAPLPPSVEDTARELYPTDVTTDITDTKRQIIKTYILAVGQSATDIPRDGFIRDGWRYELTDITEKRSSEKDTMSHTETVEITTDTKDINEIIKLLEPTMDYQSNDGYCGLLSLDLPSITCEVSGQKNSTYNVTATREYPHLSTNDLSLIPKSITENGRVLELEGVTWEVQQYANIDYADIPESYRAIAKYTAKATKTVVTGYITVADYSGEVSRTINGDTIYTVYFSGSEIDNTPEMIETAPTTPPPVPSNTDTQKGSVPAKVILIGFAIIIALLAGVGVYWFVLRHNVKYYRVDDGQRVLAAKDKLRARNLSIDLSQLDSNCFIIEIDKLAAKTLNGHTVEVRNGTLSLKHKIAFEGKTYSIEADFNTRTIRAIY